ncbi:MAG: hypothetical protein ACM3OB_07225 [Acidobacteriota bacterium]
MTRSRLAWLVPLALCLVHATLFGAWIVDDAGISFAYARNLAHGYGLVSQPGQPPVEGFSNPLWTFALVPAFWAGWFDPVWTPKIVAAGCIGLAFALLARLAGRSPSASPVAIGVGLGVVALATPFVAWSFSGLENALSVLLVAAAAERSERLLAVEPRRGSGALLGLALAAAALTRPDAVLFVTALPLLLLIGLVARRSARPLAAALLVAAVVWGGVYGGFLLWRRWYFGDWLPNTYYAKGGPHATDVFALLTLRPDSVARWLEAAWGAAGPLGGWLLAGLGIALVLCLAHRTLSPALAVVAVYLGIAGAAYVLLPRDWMPEFRFATPFVALFPLACTLAAGDLLSRAQSARGARLKRGLAITAAVAAVLTFLPRSLTFAAAPTVPFADVVRAYGDGFNRMADELGVRQGAVLLPDVGGTLWASRLRVVDLGKLCDRTIARTMGKDQRAFYDYVFDRTTPVFIHFHGAWSAMARLDSDPRFERDYVPLLEYEDDWFRKMTGATVRAGDFVRRDIAAAHPIEVAAIRQELAVQHALGKR